jgi:hypothetical protein
MHRFIRTLVATAAGIALATSLVTTTAVAGRPLERERFDIDESHIEQEEHEGFCPDIEFLVLYEEQGHGSFVFTQRGDGLAYGVLHLSLSATFTNMETGQFFTQSLVINSRDHAVTVNDDTLTITVRDAVHITTYDSEGKRLFSDSGLIEYELLIDHSGTPGDPSDDEFLEFLGETKSAGHFETADRDFCADIAEFIG